MGMFDTINEELFCPFCGELNKEFQTKDLSNFLAVWTIKEIKNCCEKDKIIEIYCKCKKCKQWISINLNLRRIKLNTTKGKK